MKKYTKNMSLFFILFFCEYKTYSLQFTLQTIRLSYVEKNLYITQHFVYSWVNYALNCVFQSYHITCYIFQQLKALLSIHTGQSIFWNWHTGHVFVSVYATLHIQGNHFCFIHIPVLMCKFAILLFRVHKNNNKDYLWSPLRNS